MFLDEYSHKIFAYVHDSLMLRYISGGNKVVKPLGYNIVIYCKFGLGVTQGEAEAQTQNFDRLNPAIIRVPRVYNFHYDRKQNFRYLAMEWVDGMPPHQ